MTVTIINYFVLYTQSCPGGRTENPGTENISIEGWITMEGGLR